MTGNRFKRVVVVALTALAAAWITWLIIKARPSPNVVLSSKGFPVTLERYEFHTTKVRYELPSNSLSRRLGRLLPERIGQGLNLGIPALVDVVEPEFPGEHLLSTAFSWDSRNEIVSVRIVVTDDEGNEFDPVANDAGGFQGQFHTQYWVGEIPVFPRRARELRLKLMSHTNFIAEFRIANPALALHPTWTAKPLPITAKDGDFEATLVDFRSGNAAGPLVPQTGRYYPTTKCVFRIGDVRSSTNVWQPIGFEISDATGNHWQVSPRIETEGVKALHSISTWFNGALWAGESAWKVRAEFKRIGEFSAEELLHIREIRIPLAAEFYQPKEAMHNNMNNS